MPSSIEKTYSEALFSLILEEDAARLEPTLSELVGVNAVFRETPEFIKLMNTPTVSSEERLSLLHDAFGGRVSEYVYNFLAVLCEKGRLGSYEKILAEFTRMYNEHFGIAEATVTTTEGLSDALKTKLIEKLETLTGKKIVLHEKTDKSLIGGIVIDLGNTRLDGSVKTRLEALKKDIGSIIA